MKASPAKRCFPPIISDGARVLILGTLPGEESLRRRQYYGHPQNHFWPIIADALGEKLHENYERRVEMLTRNRLAVWDVLAQAERSGSLDSAIRNARTNDFASLFCVHPKLKTVAFNGKGAQALYRRYVTRPSGNSDALTLMALPSTSPAYTRPLEEKSALWRSALCTALRD